MIRPHEVLSGILHWLVLKEAFDPIRRLRHLWHVCCAPSDKSGPSYQRYSWLCGLCYAVARLAFAFHETAPVFVLLRLLYPWWKDRIRARKLNLQRAVYIVLLVHNVGKKELNTPVFNIVLICGEIVYYKNSIVQQPLWRQSPRNLLAYKRILMKSLNGLGKIKCESDNFLSLFSLTGIKYYSEVFV